MNQQSLQALVQSLGAFNQAAGAVTQAGLAVCQVATTLFNVHTQIAKALAEMQQFKLCTEIGLHSIGNGDCNGGDVDNPQAAGAAAQSCVQNIVSCNNYMANAGNTLKGMNQQLASDSQQFQSQANQNIRVGFGMNAENVDTGVKRYRTNQACGRDTVTFFFDGGGSQLCGQGWDVKYRKIGGLASTSQIQGMLGEIEGSVTSVNSNRDSLPGGRNPVIEQNMPSFYDRVRNEVNTIISKAAAILEMTQDERIVTPVKNIIAYSKEMQAKSTYIAQEVDTFVPKVRAQTEVLRARLTTVVSEERSLKQYLGTGVSVGLTYTAPTFFNLGTPTDGDYEFVFT
ncbi:MAG: hypothetical protein HZB66_03270 [Candidatus Aenigmarchaeota archaeon]|nr:hypothetical protein [Candidatus Aenigmarchaeota archaeon]